MQHTNILPTVLALASVSVLFLGLLIRRRTMSPERRVLADLYRARRRVRIARARGPRADIMATCVARRVVGLEALLKELRGQQ